MTTTSCVPSGLVDAPPPYQFPSAYLTGNPDFKPETLIAYEAGYRAVLGPKLTGSLSTFYNDYQDLRSTSLTPTTATYVFPYPVVFENNLEGDTYGLELSASYQMLDWWRLHFGYDLLRENIHVKAGATDATGATNETADPQQQVMLRSSMDLPRGVTLDAALRWVDTLWINNGPTDGAVVGIVPSYLGLDSRLAWKVSRALELSVTGQNLLHDHHPEYGYPSPTREEIVRSVFARITWGYWSRLATRPRALGLALLSVGTPGRGRTGRRVSAQGGVPLQLRALRGVAARRTERRRRAVRDRRARQGSLRQQPR